MSLKPEYFRYLSHFEATQPVRALFENRDKPDLIALRHDVDYSLDLALEMACWEHRRGFQATYYLLHTAAYWKDPDLVEKALQLQDFGHEVGLHCDVLTEWTRGNTDDLGAFLRDLLRPLTEAGVSISGLSAHGARECYKHGYINYWCFEEFKPANPASSEDGLSAEGIAAESEEFRIPYPGSGELVRPDHARLPLWSVPARHLGIEYNASQLSFDGYFTDSGGSWKRSMNPLDTSLGYGRHQVLMHPLHWRGSPRTYFFLSCARSGSQWLSTVLEKAASVTARHEFSLNHYWDGETLAFEKRTGYGFLHLLENRDEAVDLLVDLRKWRSGLSEDFAEANIYLEQFLPELRDLFQREAVFIHLHRRPADVVRSLMNRDWYDTPEDDRHPPIAVEGWGQLDRFEKTCWYVRDVNMRLADGCDSRIRFEKMVSDPAYLEASFRRERIAFYPRLAKNLFGRKINASTRSDFPPYDEWSSNRRARFWEICRPLSSTLGLAEERWWASLFHWLGRRWRIWLASLRHQRNPERSRVPRFMSRSTFRIQPVGCSLDLGPEGAVLTPQGQRHAYMLLGGGTWQTLAGEESGWTALPGHYCRLSFDFRLHGEGNVQVLCLYYGEDDALTQKRSLGFLSGGGENRKTMAFRPDRRWRRFNLGLHMAVGSLPTSFVLRSFQLEAIPLVAADLD